jgi:hypothetical protein
MKRDIDLIRRIILATRDAPAGESISCFEDDVARPVFLEHVRLLIEANLADGRILPGHMGVPEDAVIFRLTWDGHDYADAMNDETVWKKVREKILKPGVSWTFSILGELLKAEARKHLPGLDL